MKKADKNSFAGIEAGKSTTVHCTPVSQPIAKPNVSSRLSDVLLKLGKAHDMMARTKLTTEEYQPISSVMADVKVELFNIIKRGFPEQDEIASKADEYGFRVPYDGSNKFYDEDALKHFLAGANWYHSRIFGDDR